MKKFVLDENIPKKIVRVLGIENADHMLDLGWSGTKNGALLARSVGEGYSCLVTFDRGIPTQNDLSSIPIAVLILRPAAPGRRGIEALIRPLQEIAMLDLEPGVYEVYPISQADSGD